tara:strand:- start:74 stop:514 length:441 start_codon:yes stop_codon:yes gene_type:complete
MENKYYVPDIEEFYVGFNYESLQDPRLPDEDDSWERNTIEDEWDLKTFIGYYCVTHIELRIKHLDREDIESLGFTHVASGWYNYTLAITIPHWTDLKLRTWKDNEVIITGFRGDEEGILFQGTLKNKSELKKLMNQLGIIKNEKDK